MIFNNKVYDVLKWIALVALDALGICYQALSVVWGLPYGDQVLQTCAALSVCLGTLLGISNAQYNREQSVMHQDAYSEMVRQNNEMRDELVANLEKTYEQFAEDIIEDANPSEDEQ